MTVGLGGCAAQRGAKMGSVELLDDSELGTRIGAVAAVAAPAPMAVEGYALVGGLAGTGSRTCPAPIRAYLKQHIRVQLPTRGVDPDQLIDSDSTAVVRLDGMIPAAASRGDPFDVRVSVLAGSETTSLHGGWLYAAELKPQGSFGAAARNLGTVEGPVFVNLIGSSRRDLRKGYILGGGRTLAEYQGSIVLRRADFRLASRIRNRLNDRYGEATAEALAATAIRLRVPAEYRRRKARFVAMVDATYLEQTAELIEARVNTLVHRLAASEDKEGSEVALEAIGRDSLTKLVGLLKASDEEVRFRVARCMLNLGDDRGLGPLREMALDRDGAYRLDALTAVVIAGRQNDARALAIRLLRDRDPVVMLAAYEHLRRLGDLAVGQEWIGRSFHLEQVVQTDWRAVYVTRKGDPRVVLFGTPLTCRDNLFVQSPDGGVMVDSQVGQKFVSLVRRRPIRAGVVGPLRTGLELSEIVRALGSEPVQRKEEGLYGLGVSYTDVAAIMEQLVAKDAVAAEFWAGPLPGVGLGGSALQDGD